MAKGFQERDTKSEEKKIWQSRLIEKISKFGRKKHFLGGLKQLIFHL